MSSELKYVARNQPFQDLGHPPRRLALLRLPPIQGADHLPDHLALWADDGSPIICELATLARYCQDNMTPRRAKNLAVAFHLPPGALDALPMIGWHSGKCCYTFPEMNPAGKVIGLFLCWIWPTWTEKAYEKGKSGLYLPIGWRQGPGPVRIVAGPLDTLAMAYLKVPCVGRPSGVDSADMLIELLREDGRPIVVVGRNDMNGNSNRPRREEAESIVERLRAGLPGRDIMASFPPPGYMDVRDWVFRNPEKVMRLRAQSPSGPEAP